MLHFLLSPKLTFFPIIQILASGEETLLVLLSPGVVSPLRFVHPTDDVTHDQNLLLSKGLVSGDKFDTIVLRLFDLIIFLVKY